MRNLSEQVDKILFFEKILEKFKMERIDSFKIFLNQEGTFNFSFLIHPFENKYFFKKKIVQILEEQYFYKNYEVIIKEIEFPYTSSKICCREIALQYGKIPLKLLSNNIIDRAMNQNILGIRIVYDGKLFGLRNKKKIFQKGYLKMAGNPKYSYVSISRQPIFLKQGVINVTVMIIHNSSKLYDRNIRNFLNEKK